MAHADPVADLEGAWPEPGVQLHAPSSVRSAGTSVYQPVPAATSSTGLVTHSEQPVCACVREVFTFGAEQGFSRLKRSLVTG